MKRRSVILGTDWWTDCDDVVALRLLARKHKEGAIRLLGIAVNAVFELSAPSVSALLQSEGLTDIPIGLDAMAQAYTSDPSRMYQAAMAKHPHYAENADCEDAIKLYRRLLASSTEKVDMVEIGFTQLLAALLRSEGDEISPLTGAELIKQKVNKLWMMAGKWDVECGKEYNFSGTQRTREASPYVVANWPTEIVFLGFEVGVSVLTGGRIEDKSDIVARAIIDHGDPMGRSSWDPMTALLACVGDPESAGYRLVRGRASVNENGENFFEESEDGAHGYVVKTMPDRFYADAIDGIIA